MNRQEHQLQVAVISYLRLALPPEAFVTSLDLATSSEAEGQAKRRRGCVAGMPDIMVAHAKRVDWLELKAPKGKVTPEQLEVAARLQSLGHGWHIARSVEEVEGILRRSGVALRATTMTAPQRDAALAVRTQSGQSSLPLKRKPSRPSKTAQRFYASFAKLQATPK